MKKVKAIHRGVTPIIFESLSSRTANRIYDDLERMEFNEQMNRIKTPVHVKRAFLDAWSDATNITPPKC